MKEAVVLAYPPPPRPIPWEKGILYCCFLFSFCLFSVGGFASDICMSESPIFYTVIKWTKRYQTTLQPSRLLVIKFQTTNSRSANYPRRIMHFYLLKKQLHHFSPQNLMGLKAKYNYILQRTQHNLSNTSATRLRCYTQNFQIPKPVLGWSNLKLL